MLYPIAPLGFFAKGPKILQYRIRKDGRDVTHIRTPGYVFADGAGKTHDFGAVATAGPVTIRSSEPDRLSILLAEGGGPVRIRPGRIAADWDLASTHLFRLNENRGAPRRDPHRRRRRRHPNRRARLLRDGLRPEARPPQPRCRGRLPLRFPGASPAGRTVTLSLTVANRGRIDAKEASVRFFIETPVPRSPDRRREDLRRGRKVGRRHVQARHRGLGRTPRGSSPRSIPKIASPNSSRPTTRPSDDPDPPDYARWKFRVPVEVLNGPVPQEDVPVVWTSISDREMKKLGGSGALAPDSVRIAAKRPDGTPGKALPCQFDRRAGLRCPHQRHGRGRLGRPRPHGPGRAGGLPALFRRRGKRAEDRFRRPDLGCRADHRIRRKLPRRLHRRLHQRTLHAPRPGRGAAVHQGSGLLLRPDRLDARRGRPRREHRRPGQRPRPGARQDPEETPRGHDLRKDLRLLPEPLRCPLRRQQGLRDHQPRVLRPRGHLRGQSRQPRQGRWHRRRRGCLRQMPRSAVLRGLRAGLGALLHRPAAGSATSPTGTPAPGAASAWQAGIPAAPISAT